VDATQIGVIVEDGIVTLTGHVSVDGDKFEAERLARRIYGVRAVADDIEVQIPDPHQRTDAEIAAAALAAPRRSARLWYAAAKDQERPFT